MPNIVHLPMCPFYKFEKRKSICCEDTYRGFNNTDDKYAWMYMYCDSWDWMKCPYAIDRSEAYERSEKGDDKALENQEKEAMKKEMKSLSTKLGRAEKKIERMQKKIDELRYKNQSFVNVNDTLHKKWRKADSDLKAYEENIANQIQQLADAYETRLAYMVDTYGTFSDKDVDAWREDKQFALVADFIDDGKEVTWKVVFKEDGEDNNVSDAEEQTQSE